MDADQVIAGYLGLRPPDRRRVETAIAGDLGRRWHRGVQARLDRVQCRNQAVSLLVAELGLPQDLAGWRAIRNRLLVVHPMLALARALPSGATLDTMPIGWIKRRVVSARSLRRSYLRGRPNQPKVPA